MWQVSPTSSRNGVIFRYWKIFQQRWHCIFLVQQSKEVQKFLLDCWTLCNTHPATQHPDNTCQIRMERERAVTLCPHGSIAFSPVTKTASPTTLSFLCDAVETTISQSQVHEQVLGSVSLYWQPAVQLTALHKHQTWHPKCKWPCQLFLNNSQCKMSYDSHSRTAVFQLNLCQTCIDALPSYITNVSFNLPFISRIPKQNPKQRPQYVQVWSVTSEVSTPMTIRLSLIAFSSKCT